MVINLICILEIHSFNKHLLSTYFVAGTIPGTEKQNKIRNGTCPRETPPNIRSRYESKSKLAAQRTAWSALLGRPGKVSQSRRGTWQRSLVTVRGDCRQRKQAISGASTWGIKAHSRCTGETRCEKLLGVSSWHLLGMRLALCKELVFWSIIWYFSKKSKPAFLSIRWLWLAATEMQFLVFPVRSA